MKTLRERVMMMFVDKHNDVEIGQVETDIRQIGPMNAIVVIRMNG